MKHFKVFVFLFMGIFMAAGSNSFASTPGEVIWWEFENAKEESAGESDEGGMAAFLKMKKILTLYKGAFPLSETAAGKPDRLTTGNTEIWVRNPDGVVSKANIAQDSDSIVLNLPSDLNPGDLSGRYLVGVHMDAGIMDIDSDGMDEKVHLYSKYLVNYSKQDGVKGKNPDTFFREGGKLALEIGPAVTKSIFKSAGCPHKNVIKGKGTVTSYVSDGGTQTPLKEYRMNVLFKGEPLANTEVLVLSQSGWSKTVITDPDGAISFTPPNTLERASESEGSGGFHGMSGSGMGKGMDKGKAGAESGPDHASVKAGHPGSRGDGDASEAKDSAGIDKTGNGKRMSRGRMMMQSGGDKLLYMVAYRDPSTGEYHCATLPVSLRGSMATDEGPSGNVGGFTLWGIIGAGLCTVGLGGSVYHRKRRNRDRIFRSKK